LERKGGLKWFVPPLFSHKSTEDYTQQYVVDGVIARMGPRSIRTGIPDNPGGIFIFLIAISTNHD